MADWLLKGTPREIQMEALSRSYEGIATRNIPSDTPKSRQIKPGRSGPFAGWGHLLEMRLGKTPATLNEFMLFKRDHGFEKLLIIAPNKFKPTWPVEAEAWGLDVPVLSLESDERAKAQRFFAKEKRWLTAISYESLVSDKNMEILTDLVDKKTMIVADESINLKNNRSIRFKRAFELGNQARVKRILSGKPITQGPHDLWAQLKFIDRMPNFNYWAFKNTFCKMGGYMNKEVKGAQNEDWLHEILQECSFTARKVDWLKTGGVDYSERRLELTADQILAYKRMEDDFLLEIAQDEFITAEQIITKLIKLQQIASGFVMDGMGKAHELVRIDKNPKVQEIVSILEDEIDTKLIVVCHFTHSISMLMQALEKFNPAQISGRVNNNEVINQKIRFNEDPNCRVLIGQERSLKYGHTLMGNPRDPCYTTVFFENSYSLDDRAQCEERNQGAGQDVPVNIIDFYASPHDLDIIRSLQRKEDVAAKVLKYRRETGVLPHQ